MGYFDYVFTEGISLDGEEECHNNFPNEEIENEDSAENGYGGTSISSSSVTTSCNNYKIEDFYQIRFIPAHFTKKRSSPKGQRTPKNTVTLSDHWSIVLMIQILQNIYIFYSTERTWGLSWYFPA